MALFLGSFVLNLAMTVFLLRVLSMGPTALISSGHVYYQFNTALKLIVWLIRGMCARSERKISRKDLVWPKINIQSESHKIFSMPICLQRPKEAFECGPGPLTHILNGLKCIQIISWKHSLKWSSNFTVEFYEYWPCWAPEPGALYLALTSSWHSHGPEHETGGASRGGYRPMRGWSRDWVANKRPQIRVLQ